MKTLKILAVLALIAGSCLTSRALYMHAKADLAGVLIRRAWEQGINSGHPHKPWPWADTYPIARLRIPRLGYDEIVLENATARTLAFGPARLLSGPGFGEPGNVVLAGHRTSWFRSLQAIAPGDRIQIDWFDTHSGKLRERSYDVTMIRVVDPKEMSLLGPTPADDDALTLITCYPFSLGPTSPQRFIVRASPLRTSRLAQVRNDPQFVSNPFIELAADKTISYPWCSANSRCHFPQVAVAF